MREQTGLCFVGGVLVCGLYRAEKEIRDNCQTITIAGKTHEIGKIYERLGTRLRVFRAEDGTQILRTGRTSLFVSPRRLQRIEKKHKVKFDFVPATDVPADWFRLSKDQKLQIACQIAKGVKYVTDDSDLPNFLLTAAPLLPSPTKPMPTVKRPVVETVPPRGNARESQPALAKQWLRAIGLVLLGAFILAAPFLAIRGIQLLVGSAATVIIMYSILAACVVSNKQRERTGVEQAF
jgi:hypothetical protein